jgi:hypothetical protein
MSAAAKPRKALAKPRRQGDPLEPLRREDAARRLNDLPAPVTMTLEAPRVSVWTDLDEVECRYSYAIVLSDDKSAVIVTTYNDRALAAEHAAHIAAALAWDWRQP